VKIPRFTIAWLMIGTATIAFPCAIVGSVMRNRPMFGLEYCLDMGLSTTIPVLAVYLCSVLGRRASIRPFDIGFLAFGWAAVVIFVVAAWAFPHVIATPIVYYINEIEPYFLECDLEECYVFSLLIRGAILAAPQLLVAFFGGLVVRAFANRRAFGRSGGRAG
jgi:hypothetical protein